MPRLEENNKGFLKANWRWLSPLLSLIIDLFLLNLSFVIAIFIRAGSLYIYPDYTKPLVFFNGMFFIFALGLGLYRSRYNLSLKELRFSYKRLVIYLAISTMAFLYIIKRGQFYSRAIILITFFLFWLLLEAAHALFKKVQGNLINRGAIGFKTMVIGANQWTYRFFRHISVQFGGFFQVCGYIQEESQKKTGGNRESEPGIIGELSQFDKVVEQYRPDMVFIASDAMEMDNYQSVYETCRSRGIRLKMISSRVGNVLNNSRIRDVSGVSLVVENWRERLRAINTAAKRIFDLFFVTLITPVLLPLGILIAALIKVTSKGPVFFRQKRSLYQGGREFEFIKFRSMYRDADSLKETLFDTNEADGALFKLKKDPRITPFGRIIRKLSLDELPQFINVLKGDMSIVGPRPLPVEDFSKIYQEGAKANLDWYKKRGEAKPGITGLWQISGRSELPFEDMLYLDLYYVEHQSVFLDLEILFETIPAVLLGRGAY